MEIDDIQQIAARLPATGVEIKWKSDLVFLIGQKMFALLDLESVPTTLAFKVPAADFDELAHAPDFRPAPYFAKNNWVTLLDIAKLKPDDCEFFLRQSYGLVAAKLSKKVKTSLGIGELGC